MNLTSDDFKKLGIKNRDEYIPYFNKYLTQFKINTVDRLLAFFGNLLHESANLYYTKEIASGIAYENRKDLGNIFPGDGVKFAGRSFGQITGRSNYKAFTEWCKLNISNFKDNFEKNPELLEKGEYAVLGAFWFWKVNKLEQYADKKDYRNVCSIWNTGKINSKNINGWEDRLKKYELVKSLLKSWI